MEELHIQKSPDLPNDHLIFRFELHFGYNMEVQPNDPLIPLSTIPFIQHRLTGNLSIGCPCTDHQKRMRTLSIEMWF